MKVNNVVDFIQAKKKVNETILNNLMIFDK